uniref:Uncharacterized protein n=1 Tax=Anguilla anguilla TaxID=7936 RepID=A0A0E9SIX5_ANGAN
MHVTGASTSHQTHHDGREVHAGDSVHDDEDPGVGQVVEAVVQPQGNMKTSSCRSK